LKKRGYQSILKKRAQFVIIFKGDGTKGYKNGNGTTEKFNFPVGITIDKDRNIFIGEHYIFKTMQKLYTGGI
jgi:hypothetical protein